MGESATGTAAARRTLPVRLGIAAAGRDEKAAAALFRRVGAFLRANSINGTPSIAPDAGLQNFLVVRVESLNTLSAAHTNALQSEFPGTQVEADPVVGLRLRIPYDAKRVEKVVPQPSMVAAAGTALLALALVAIGAALVVRVAASM